MAKKKDKNITPKHGRFSFTKPTIVKTDKQWWIYYSIKYLGEPREYRKDYGGKDMQFNRIKNLTERQIAMDYYIKSLVEDLHDGIDLKRVEEAREILQTKAEEKQKYNVQLVYDKWWLQSGYANPTETQKYTAANFENLFIKRFIPYLTEKKLMSDIRDIKKTDIKEFLNRYQHEEKIWSKNTTKVKNQWLGAFFRFAVDNDLIEYNPTHGISINGPSSPKNARFQAFTRQEIAILFNEIEQSDFHKLELVIKGLYYSYIRISEWLRLRVNNIDLTNMTIIIHPEQSKTGHDGIARNVQIHPYLLQTLHSYLTDNVFLMPENKLLFNDRRPDKNVSISDMTLRAYWRDFFKSVKEKHPDKFNRTGLSLYSFKHSGVTHFYEDNIGKSTSQKLIDFIKKQCRHKSITTTEIYLRDDLGIDIDGSNNFYSELLGIG